MPRRTRPPWLARSIFALIVACYPARIRRRYSQDMKNFFEDSFIEATTSSGRPKLTAFYIRSFWDLLVNLVLSHSDRFGNNPAKAQAPNPQENALVLQRKGFAEYVMGAANSARHSFRVVRKAPTYSLLVVLTLGLGIGASTAIFTVVDGILLSSLPYPNAGNLLVIQERSPLPDGRSSWVSEPTFRDWREQTEAFADIVAWRLHLATITGDDRPERVQGYVVSSGFFDLMGVEMTLGRGFLAEEDRPDANKVVVISPGLWQRRFGSDPEILGERLMLDGIAHTIVGVAGNHLDYPEKGDVWSPIALEYEAAFRGFRYLGVIGRLREGKTHSDAVDDLNRINAGIVELFPETNSGWGVESRELKEQVLWGVRPILVGLTIASVLLLIIAVGNVLNLVVARIIDRRAEVAVRRALGATRTVLARLFVTESLVLSLLGGSLGIVVAYWGTEAIGILAQEKLPRLDAVSVDANVLIFAFALSILIGLAVGLLPLCVSPLYSIGRTLGGGRRTVKGDGSANLAREIILTVQVALAITLLVGASLLAKSLLHLNQIDPGFNQRNLLSFELNLPETGYDRDRILTTVPEIVQRISDIPGIEGAGTVHPMPMVLGSVASRYTVESSDGAFSNELPAGHARIVSPGYLETMQIPLLYGRYLDSSDRFGSLTTVVVNKTFADRYLPQGNPLGARITSQDPEDPNAYWSTVVGVVGDVRFRTLVTETEPEVYTSVQQWPYGFGQLVMRTRATPESIMPQVASLLRDIDPDLPIARVLTGADVLERSFGPARLNFVVISIFAVVAAVLSIVGVVGVLTLIIGRRMQEIGIRMVLGADSKSVLSFVTKKGMRPVVFGSVLGLVAASGLTRFVSSQIHGVSPLDPYAFLVPASVFLVAAIVACQLPARRAASVDPATVMREV